MNFQLISCAQETKSTKNKIVTKTLNIKTGAERTDLYLNLLKGKNIAIVANQTSVLTTLRRAEIAPNIMGSKKITHHLVDFLYDYNGTQYSNYCVMSF